VGVVGDVKQERLDEKPQPQIYLGYQQQPSGFGTLAVRTASDPMQFVAAVREAVWSVDKDQPVWKVRSMEQMLRGELGDRRYLAYLLSLYAALATLLAAVGTYGVLNYNVHQRMREMGVRIALGAQTADTLRMVVADGMKKVALGIAIGVACALTLARALSGLLYGVGSSDPATLAAGIGVLTLAALLACWIPARRATRVDPMKILRTE
jgi:putative ABC transport system permease protein